MEMRRVVYEGDPIVIAGVGAHRERSMDIRVEELENSGRAIKQRWEWSSIELARETWFTDGICWMGRLELQASD